MKGHPVLIVLAIAAAALALVVAMSAIGLPTGRMRPDLAAALVRAARLSVLRFPTIAGGPSSAGSLGTVCPARPSRDSLKPKRTLVH
jgi:hypothetical protein